MKLLLVTLYFPPAGGGGVQRPLKFASHLPALGIETHVLAPDDPKWVHEDADLPLPTQAWIHRARYLGPRSRRLADELHGRSGLDLALRRASSVGRRLLLPDENVTWNATAIPKAISIVRREGIDVVLTTSPPGSVHLIGAAVQKATGAKWVADLRDSIVLHPHRSVEGTGARAKQKARAGIARLVAHQADAIVAAGARGRPAGRGGREARARGRSRTRRRAGRRTRHPRRAARAARALARRRPRGHAALAAVARQALAGEPCRGARRAAGGSDMS